MKIRQFLALAASASLAAALLSACGGELRRQGEVVSDIRADVPGVEVAVPDSHPDLGADVCFPNCKAGECGVDGCGGYCPVCATPSAEFTSVNPWFQVNYTLCDETTRKCIVPTASCEDGWCRIPAGSFVMGVNEGCPEESGLEGIDFRTITHVAVITRPFLMMETEVTMQQWMAIMGDLMENPSLAADCGPTCPIGNISVFDIVVYANRLSQLAGLDECYERVGCTQDSAGHFDCERAIFTGPDCTGFRLPSFAEWQLAAGTSSDKCLFTGPALEDACLPEEHVCEDMTTALFEYAWVNNHCDAVYDGCIMQPSGTQKCCGIHPVASLSPNAFGLYDTAGNVQEWIGTVDPTGGVPDPVAPVEVDPGYDSLEGQIVTSGGSFVGGVWVASPSHHMPLVPYEPNAFTVPTWLGFRLVRTGW